MVNIRMEINLPCYYSVCQRGTFDTRAGMYLYVPARTKLGVLNYPLFIGLAHVLKYYFLLHLTDIDAESCYLAVILTDLYELCIEEYKKEV